MNVSKTTIWVRTLTASPGSLCEYCYCNYWFRPSIYARISWVLQH